MKLWIRAALTSAGIAVLGTGTAGMIIDHQHHERACAPFRTEASKQNTALRKLRDTPFSPIEFGDPADQFQGDLDALQAHFNQEDDAYRAYYTTVTRHASCFDDNLVTGAKTWLREQEHRDSDTQYYWYCWNSGDPSPHHIGHPVLGDHLCTWGELRQAGMAQ